MSNKKVQDYLSIEIPHEMKEYVLSFETNTEYDIAVKMEDIHVVSGIDFKKVGKRTVLDWEKTLSRLRSNLQVANVRNNWINRISALAAKNYESIKDYVMNLINAEEKEEENLENQKKQKIKVFKYYSENDQTLYESAVIGGIPCFVYLVDDQVDVKEKIEENTRTLVPFGGEDSIAKPYQFDNIDSLNELVEKTKKVSIGHIYQTIKQIVQKYIAQESNIINIITIDIIFSYFQDRFPTTHYLFFIGDNGVGKSVIGELFELVAYRGVKMTDPSSANIYRLLGKVQPAQCTLIMDEVEKIDDNQEMMNILKAGYTLDGKIPKINTATYDQEFFNAYSLKVFLSERLPQNYTAKGVLDRTFALTCYAGNPSLHLKDVLVSQGERGNQFLKELQEEIMNLRKQLFIYRLIHAHERRPEISIGLENRDKELCEGVALFFNTEVQREVEETFQHFLDAKYEQKENSFDVFLLRKILAIMETDGEDNILSVFDLWNRILDTEDCTQVKANELFLPGFGIKLYYNQISNRCKVFGAKIKHTSKGNFLAFDLDRLNQVLKEYTKKPKITCSSIKHYEGCEGCEGSGERTPEIYGSNDDNKDEVNGVPTIIT